MFGTPGFSVTGFVFLLCLLVPSLIWSGSRGERPAGKEHRGLLVLERIGQAALAVLLPLCRDTDPRRAGTWPALYGAAWICMALYLIFWIRYFRGPRTLRAFYRPLAGVPLPGAVLPAAAALLLALYGRVWALGIAAVLFGAGHIGIHAGHRRALER